MRTSLVCLGSAVLAASFVAVLDYRLAERDPSPVIEVVDLQQLLTEQVTDVSHQKLSVDQQRAAATTYATALNDALEAVQRGDHAVLLVKPAVISGAVDVTDRVRTLIQLGAELRTPTATATTPATP